MDFQSPGKDPDTSVKIYLSIQKQAKRKRSQEGSVRLEEEFCAQLFKVGQRQQLGGWGDQKIK